MYEHKPTNRISELTRRNIIDSLLLRHEEFSGRLDKVTFLARVWPLADMPSTDHREPTLQADLTRHIYWGDYDDSEVLYGKLNIASCSDAEFGRFLSECVHPLVRYEKETVAEYIALMNSQLEVDGFAITEISQISKRPVYGMVEVGSHSKTKEHRYEIALSFAGEQRAYVDQVAKLLVESGVSVFYDEFEEAHLWGQDLTEAFDEVFLRGSKFVVMFISESYANKMWPNYERRAAIESAMKRNESIILPVRFDDTSVPGIRETIGYVSATTRTPEQLVKLILARLKRPLS